MTPDEIRALEAGRELDALVAEKVLGFDAVWTSEQEVHAYMAENPDTIKWPTRSLPLTLKIDDGGCWCAVLAHYSTSIADAWEVVEKLYVPELPDLGFCVTRGPATRPGWLAWFGWNGREAEAPTASLAICRAALLAVNPRCPEHRGNEEDDGSSDARHATGQRSGGSGKDTLGSDPKAED